jgi:peptidoglycan L-alanyl-D-glutamate endopeptidase CwlK
MAAAKSFGPECRIISGTRTYAEQDQLFAIGRTIQMDRKPVTNAKGGQSNHNFGVAWDIGLFDQGRYMDGAKKGDEQAYVDLAKLVKSKVSGIEWGGDWKTFPDNPHYQLPTGLKIAEVRSRFEAGTAFA